MNASKITNVPSGATFTQFRMWLLRNVGIASAFNWKILDDTGVLIFTHMTDRIVLTNYVTSKLVEYCLLTGIEFPESPPRIIEI